MRAAFLLMIAVHCLEGGPPTQNIDFYEWHRKADPDDNSNFCKMWLYHYGRKIKATAVLTFFEFYKRWNAYEAKIFRGDISEVDVHWILKCFEGEMM